MSQPSFIPIAAGADWRRFAALVVVLAACQRREGLDERTPVLVANLDAWSFATHPAVPLAPDELRDATRRALESTGRFVPVVAAGKAEDQALFARVTVHLLGADVVPETPVEPVAAPQVAAHVRLRLEFRPPLADDSQVVAVVAAGNGRGTAVAAAKGAVDSALGRAFEQVVMELQGRTKSDEELVTELGSADRARAQTALEQLASRRHPAALGPLVQALRADDPDSSVRALTLLVTLDDLRAVRPIIEEAERRDLAFLLEAVYALGGLGGEDAEAYLYTVDSGHSDARVRAAAHEARVVAKRRERAGRRAEHTVPAPAEEQDL